MTAAVGEGEAGEETPRARAQIWKCRHCRRKLGEVTGERVEIVHEKRRIVAALPCVQVCHHCGKTNRWLAGATRMRGMDH